MSDNHKKPIRFNRSKSEKDEPHSAMAQFANTDGINQSHVDVTAMIRSLQRTEGVTDCFRTGLTECDVPECAWRKYCLSKQDGTTIKKEI